MNPSKLRYLVSNLFAGSIAGLVNVIYSISYAALIFPGELSGLLPLGISAALISAIVNALVAALRSSFPVTIAGPDSSAAAILALMAASIPTTLLVLDQEQAIFPTIWLAIIVTSVATGLFLFMLGYLQLGRFIRFIPYPVVGGFLAGVGWLLFQGSFTVMTGASLNMGQLSQFIQPSLLLLWVPGLLLALTLRVVLQRFKHFLLLPALLIGSLFLCYVGLQVTQTSVSEAQELGVLFQAIDSSRLWQFSKFLVLTEANWTVLPHQLSSILTLMAVAAITILLNATGLELAAQTDVDLDQELRTAGVGNLLTGLLGGMVGHLSISRSLLTYKAGGRDRSAGVVASLIAAGFLIMGSTVLSYLPRFIFGGLLLYLGLSLLIEWVYDAWFKLSRLDYGLVLIILLIVANFGFLQGVGMGLMIACFLFVFNYSNMQVVKDTLSGRTFHSNFERSFHQKRLLREKGDQLYILRLQGYIFFGTSNALLNQVRQRLTAPHLPTIRYLLLDFQLTGGLDASAAVSFIKMKLLTKNQGVTLVLTGLSAQIQARLTRAGVIEPSSDQDDPEAEIPCRLFHDLDRGVEWCENEIIKTSTFRRKRFIPLALQMEEIFPLPSKINRFLSYLKKQRVPEGHILFKQGDLPEAIYFIESGQVTLLREPTLQRTDAWKADNQETELREAALRETALRQSALRKKEVYEPDQNTAQRLGSVSDGTVIGEIGFYTGEPHNVSAITDEKSTLYGLSHDILQKIQTEEPELAAAFHQLMASLLADRVAQADERSQMLLR